MKGIDKRATRIIPACILMGLFLYLVPSTLAPLRADVCVNPYLCYGSAVVDRKLCYLPTKNNDTNTWHCGGTYYAYQSSVSCNSNCLYDSCSSNDNVTCVLEYAPGRYPDEGWGCKETGCTNQGACCFLPSGPTPTPGGGGGGTPQPYVKPIFRVLLDTNDDPVGDQLIYTSSYQLCNAADRLASLFTVTLTRPESLCSGATTMWTMAFHQDCFLGPGIFYTFANSPCSQDPANGNATACPRQMPPDGAS